MLKLLKFLLPASGRAEPSGSAAAEAPAPPAGVVVDGVESFLASHLVDAGGVPLIDWQAAQSWLETVPDQHARGHVWSRLERAWLDHMRAALGPPYAVRETETALLLSTLEPNVAGATLGFMAKTLQRITRVLDGVAHSPEWGKDILIVFDDEESYYRYVSHYYPEGEFAASGGMYINAGCGHFVTVKSDLRVIEPTIVHEMTHGCLGHLPIPAWLNEGLAVNTEQRLSPHPSHVLTPHQMHAKHRRFWGDAEIQQFWSGRSFLRNDDGNMLSYDLARILVAQLSGDWPKFRAFALAANIEDSGAAAAAEHLQLDLGAVVAVLLEREPEPAWAPDPAAWNEAPERGAF